MSLVVVGMGPGDGRYLLPAALEAINSADVLAGDERHLLAFRQRFPNKRFISSEHGLRALLDRVGELKDTEHVALLVSGDPCLYSLRAAVHRRWGGDSYDIVPGISSLQLLCCRAKLAWDGAHIVSVHGTDLTPLVGLDPQGTTLIFCDKNNTPDQISTHLLNSNTMDSNRRVVVGECLGYPEERVIDTTLIGAASGTFNSLCVVIIPALEVGNTIKDIYPYGAKRRIV